MNTPLENQHLEQVLLTALAALTRDDVRPWVEMFAPEGIQEFPYAPAGNPTRLVGKPAVAAYLADYTKMVHLHHIGPCTFRHSADATVVEFTAEGHAVPTGNQFTMQYVSIIEHQGGKITRYIDYWNPLVALAALGGQAALSELGKSVLAV